METDSAFDDMDVEEDLELDADMDEDAAYEGWEARAADVTNIENWGLSDGDGSEDISEVEGLAMSGELPAEDDGMGVIKWCLCSLMLTLFTGAAVYSDGGENSGALQAPEDESTEPK